MNAAQPDGATALAWAVHLGERRMAEALLDSGARANTADEYGETPVTLAAANGDAALVERLIAAGGNARAARWNGETAVMIAAAAGSLETVRQLVRHGADVNAAEPRGGQTALMWAAAEGHSDVVAGLVEMGANVDAASRTGFTPLVFAAIKDDVAVDQDAAQGRRQSERRPPLRRQTDHRRHAVPAHGGRAGAARRAAPTSPCAIAAGTRRSTWRRRPATWSSCARCSPKRADPNVRTPKSMAPAGRSRRRWRRPRRVAGEQTPLMMAARDDHEDVMRALVAAGADPGAQGAGRHQPADGRRRGSPAQDVHLRLRDRSAASTS